MRIETIIRYYNIESAAFCAVIATAVYIPVRAVWLRARHKARKPMLAETANALLAGYFAALVNIVWFPVFEFIDILTSDPAAILDISRGGYYARNYEIFRCLFVDFKPLRLLHDFEILANVALFVPLGFLLPIAFRRLKWWQVDLICLGTTCVVELVQPIFGRAGDIDDVITNALGGVIGCAAAGLVFKIFGRKRVVSYEKE
ncbi:MAG: VanZ family protein [Ruminococcaceae bacterium]|nr:VanZ family protein [Oscillospiraceae bacterium]